MTEAKKPTERTQKNPGEQVRDNVLREGVISVLRTVFDPEIPVNIYDLGLIYAVDIDEGKKVRIDMTLTSPSCPAAQSLPPEVEMKARTVPGVEEAKVTVVWDPPWTQEKMTEAARLQLGLM